VQRLADSVHVRQQMITMLYKYMQHRCRYVSVQLGIGGWQTLSADFVGTNQYGDCKGLSNYTKSLLDAAGIASYPVLISAGDDFTPLVRGFPSPLFNHEILCVPNGKDTIWLECTSTNNDAGYLGNFTGDRDGLMITPEGGVLVHTPRLSEAQSVLKRQVISTATDEGACDMHLIATHSGYFHDRLFPHVMNQSNDELARYVNQKFGLSSYTANKFRFERAPANDVIPAITEDVDLRAEGLISKSSTRQFINLNFIPLELPEASVTAIRRTPFTIQNTMSIEDEFEMRLPFAGIAEQIPAPVHIRQSFGSFDCDVTYNTNSATVHRKYILKAGTYGPDQFQAFKKMLDTASAASTYRTVVLVR
jgi:hypothetical protein